MPDRRIFDSITETKGVRLPVHKEGDRTTYEYSNGAEVIVEKTAEGDGQRLKEVRTITRARGPRRYFYSR
jgi:hypothetical protein